MVSGKELNELPAAEREALERTAGNVLTSTIEYAAGALVGSVIPGVGTAAGGFVGGSLGWIIGLVRRTETPIAALVAEPQKTSTPVAIFVPAEPMAAASSVPEPAAETPVRNDRYREAREIANRMRLRPASTTRH